MSIFAEMQMLNNLSEDNTVVASRKVLNRIVEWFKEQPDYMHFCKIFAEQVRNLDVDTLLKADGFFVNPDMLITQLPDEFKHDSYGFCYGDRLRFSGRFVYPVKDVRGDVMGFCGYDKFSDAKYLDSRNYGYVAKDYSMWGMETLPIDYKGTHKVFFVEGIVCALYLRQCGLSAYATLGSNFTVYIMEIMKRFENRCIYVADSDEAGTKTRRRLNRYAPMVRVIQSKMAKDVDDSRKVDSSFIDELRNLDTPFYRSKLFR